MHLSGNQPGFRPSASNARRISPAHFIGFLYLSFATNYPGHLNPDSLEQLVWAAHPSRMTDWHSPVVTWIWSLGGPVLGQPAGALSVQCLCLSFFVAVLPVFQHHNARTIILLLIESFFRLSRIAIAGIVIKDVLLLALILVIIAALAFFGVASEGRYLLPTVCCACIATLIALRPLARHTTAAQT